MKNIKPIYLYICGAICFIISKQLDHIAILNYGFVAIGFVLIFLAIRKYFRK